MDDSKQPLEPWIDPALEARAVAHILGESSDFEKAEMEKLIAEQPELAAFVRRIQAVHGLLGEAAAHPARDSKWKLSPARRAKLEPLLQGESSKRPTRKRKGAKLKWRPRTKSSEPNPPRGPAWWGAMAAVICLGLFLGSYLLVFQTTGSKGSVAGAFSSDGSDSQRMVPIDVELPDDLAVGTPKDINQIRAQLEKKMGEKKETEKDDRFVSGRERRATELGTGFGAIEEAPLPEQEPLKSEDGRASGGEAAAVVGGQVRVPGRLAAEDGLTAGEALAAAGGVDRFGQERRVTLEREGKMIALNMTDETDRDFALRAGDTLEVDERRSWGIDDDAAPADMGRPKRPDPYTAANTPASSMPEAPEPATRNNADAFAMADAFPRTPATPDGFGDISAPTKYDPPQLPGSATIDVIREAGAAESDEDPAYFARNGSPTGSVADNRSSDFTIGDDLSLAQGFGGSGGGGTAGPPPATNTPPPAPPATPDMPAKPGSSVSGLSGDDRVELESSVLDGQSAPLVAGYASQQPDQDFADYDRSSRDLNLEATFDREVADAKAPAAEPLPTLGDRPLSGRLMKQRQNLSTENRKRLQGGKPVAGDASGLLNDVSDSDKENATRSEGHERFREEAANYWHFDNALSRGEGSGVDAKGKAAMTQAFSGAAIHDLPDASGVKQTGEKSGEAIAAQGEVVRKNRERADKALVEVERLQKASEMAKRESRLEEQSLVDGLPHEGDLKQSLQQAEKKLSGVLVEWEEEREVLDDLAENTITRKRRADSRPPEPKPRPKPAPVLEEGDTQKDPTSTFSLHVSDATYKLAEAALLERGEWPDPTALRTEDFVNHFDYGDPAPTGDQPVTCALGQAAHPFLPGRNLVRISLRTGTEGRAPGQPLSLTVLLDNSGSMERPDRRGAVQAALNQLTSLLGPQDVVTLFSFARQPRLLGDRLQGDAARHLPRLAAQAPPEGGTNIEEALRVGGDAALRQFNPAAQNRVVLFTDGVANLGNTVPDSLARRVEDLRQQKVAVDVTGVGTLGLDDAVLEAIARKGDGRYHVLGDARAADSGFARALAGAFRPAARNVKVQVRFNPDRVGRFHLLGFEKHRLKEEDFRDDSVDAAEMAAAEQGSAVYQVELLPDGRGEIGDIAVRFLDTATGRMVERHWTIPYDENTPALDQAKPGIQLAATAALFAERLRGTPIGGLVQLDELTPVLNQLRGHFPADPRVQRFIQAVQRARSLDQ